MKTTLLTLSLFCLTASMYTQVLELKVGMSEKDLVQNSIGSRMESGMTFLQRKGTEVVFSQETDSSYQLTLTIKTHKGKICKIKKEHVGSSLEQRRRLFAEYKSAIVSRQSDGKYTENQELAISSSQEFLDRGVRAKAFNSKSKRRTLKEVFLFYNNKTDSVFIEISDAE